MKITIILLTCLFHLSSYQAQTIPSKIELVSHFGFKEESISTEQEKINYYIYSKGDAEKKKLVMYLQGSDPSPQFSYRIKEGQIEKLCWLHGEHTELTDEYLYVVVEKIGFEGVINEDHIPRPKIYQQKNSLENRVLRTNRVIHDLCATFDFEKVIVYGHSEGAPVAAKLGTLNKKITHLGFWAANALPDFYDFVLESRIQYYKGNISVEEAQKRIDETIHTFVNEVAKDTSNTEGGGYTNKRWWSYSEPPLHNLLKIDIPIFVQVATNDNSAPIESSYLIPLEFARLGKTNLTYKVCVGCDHGFNNKKEDGTVERNWKKIFNEFMEWSNKK